MVFAISAWAAPDQIEIIGIVAGETTQLEAKKIESNSDGFVIGGYKLLCIHDYIDGVLSDFICVTGKANFSQDQTADSFRLASNIEVHAALFEGFTKKFGPPQSNVNSTLTNALGIKINQNIAHWIDKKGNSLTIMSVNKKSDEGFLHLRSATVVARSEAARRKAEEQRKF
jgi:hypothetical protein